MYSQAGDPKKNARGIKKNTLKIEVSLNITLIGLLLCIVTIGVTATMSVLVIKCIEIFFSGLVIG